MVRLVRLIADQTKKGLDEIGLIVYAGDHHVQDGVVMREVKND